VKVQGYRIELGEIEEILKQYTGVSEVIIIVEKTTGERRTTWSSIENLRWLDKVYL